MTTIRPTRWFALMALVVLFGALAAPARADVQKGTGEFSIDLGFTEFDSNVGGGNGPRAALRGGYYFTDVIGLEGIVSYASPSDSDNGGSLASAYIDIVVNVPHKRNLIPYFALGIGGAQVDNGVDDDTGLAGQALGGARFYGQKGNFGFRFEGGIQWVDTFDEASTFWTLGLGFTWTIGGPHPHDAPDNWGRPGR